AKAPVRHDTRQLYGKRARHGAQPHQLAWFCSAAVADFCAAVDTFPGGQSREWAAYVTAFTDDLNGADDMARVNVTLQPTGLITRSEDA
uniref:hypothetical protein n=1 Tax=Paenirhodobacter enshiensis TaxID=1105367 RepID=UPI0035AF4350